MTGDAGRDNRREGDTPGQDSSGHDSPGQDSPGHDTPIRVDHAGIAVESIDDAEPVLSRWAAES